jgi:hypothetical protein
VDFQPYSATGGHIGHPPGPPLRPNRTQPLYPTSHPASVSLPISPGDSNDYTLGRLGQHNVVVAVLSNGEYGTASAASVATNIKNSFPNVRIGLMVGISGSAPSERHNIRLGDIVVSAPSSDYGGVFQYNFSKII